MYFFKQENFLVVALILFLSVLIFVQVRNNNAAKEFARKQSVEQMRVMADHLNASIMREIRSSPDKGGSVLEFLHESGFSRVIGIRVVHSESLNYQYYLDEKEQPRNDIEREALLDGESKDWREPGFFYFSTPVKAEESCVKCHHMPGNRDKPVEPGYVLGLIEIEIPATAFERTEERLWHSAVFTLGWSIVLFIAFFVLAFKIAKKLEDGKNQYTFAARAGKVGIWNWNLKTGKFHIDVVLKSFLGFTDDEIKNSYYNWINLFHPEDRESVREAIETHVENRAYSFEFEGRMLDKRGSIVWVMVRGFLWNDEKGKPNSFMGSVADITALKETERELAIAKDRAEEATRLKDKFVSMLAHDLRSPFSSVLGFISLVLRNPKSGLIEEDKKLLNRSLDVGKKLVKMIDELLDFGRLQMGSIELKKEFFNAALETDHIIESLSFRLDEKGVKAVNNLPEGHHIFADKRLWLEVLQNLVSNAVKFCHKGETITIYVPDGMAGVIAVADSGEGIPEDILPKLFDKNEKTTTIGTGGEKGTGLGLPFCKEIMELHGGDLRVETEVGRGSIFFMELPLARTQMLLVENGTRLSSLLKDEAGKRGVDIVSCSKKDGVEKALAVSLVRSSVVDFTLESAEELANFIKTETFENRLPVIGIYPKGNMIASEVAKGSGLVVFTEEDLNPADVFDAASKPRP